MTTSDAFRVVVDFIFASRYGDRRGDPRIADFTFGNLDSAASTTMALTFN